MNFFEHQDQAKAYSRRLVILFALAVGVLTALLTAVLMIVAPEVFFLGEGLSALERGDLVAAFANLDWAGTLVIASIIVGVMLAASLVRSFQISRGGGRAIAESLGGILLSSSPKDEHERRLRNVVEEMAIAAGVPVPEVYVLPTETGINAFAAGSSADEAVIGVTRGALERLTRDELQAVIAHEFSHVVHGDMRLNIRLIGVLFGILFLQQIGYHLLRGTGRSRSKEAGGIVVVGLGFLVFGALGYFFGSLIKAAISRQREYLADASSVQYTRNPGAMVSALTKILQEGSQISSQKASEASHMFFADGVRRFVGGMFATHPPLEMRIQRISGRKVTEAIRQSVSQGAEATMRAAQGAAMPAGAMGFAAGVSRGVTPRAAMERVGEVSESGLKQAATFVESLPELLREAVREPYAARVAVLCALMVYGDDLQRAAQWKVLEKRLPQDLFKLVKRLDPMVLSLGRRGRIPVIELAAPALKQLTPAQYKEFRDLAIAVINADDNRVDLFEYVLWRVVESHLKARFADKSRKTQRMNMGEAAHVVLSAMAEAGHPGNEAAMRQAYASGAKVLGMPESAKLSWDLGRFDAALAQLDTVPFKLKKKVLEACAEVAATDGTISIDELELLRGVSECLGCPMPAFG